jgi:hypothetical protein
VPEQMVHEARNIYRVGHKLRIDDPNRTNLHTAACVENRAIL